MKILMLTSSFPRYKRDFMGNPVYELAKRLKERGFTIIILAPHGSGTRLQENMGGLKVYRFSYFYPYNLQKVSYGNGIPYNIKRNYLAKIEVPLFFLSELFSTIKVIKKEKIDIIHAQWILCGLIAILTKKLIKKPVVLTVRGSGLRMLPRSISKFILDNTDAIISPHPELTEIIKSLGRNDVTEIHNIIDDDQFNSNIDTSSFKKEFNIGNEHIISFIARLNEFKDPITFVKAVPYVLEKNKNVRFFMVGDGILKSKISKYIEKLNIQKSITVTGDRGDVNVILRVSTVFTALSPIENIWSNVVVEAMKCGVPCIVTKSGTTKEYLNNKVNAYLISPKNEKELAKAILYLIEHEELRENLAKNGMILMEKSGFLKEDIIKKVVEIYEGLLNKSN